jgi:geranylgeranyl pyrophosphate synthase
VSFQHIIDLVASLPEIDEWPELATTFEGAGNIPRPDWELPLIACQAAGGTRTDALPLAASIACLQLSIMLVDDILDDDPRGAHVRYGSGPVANMALAYNNLALRLVEVAPYTEQQKLAILTEIAKVGLQTAIGQHLDVQNLTGQANYWKVVTAKSTPFYGGALAVGAIAGGAQATLASQMYDLGVLFGEIIQIEDDLTDALETPANADWRQGRNNLLILYAQTTDHDDRDRFGQLLPQIDAPDALAEAQKILVSSGAVAYCAYLLIGRYQQADRLLADMKLPDRPPLEALLDNYADSLLQLLHLTGVELPREELRSQITHRPLGNQD